VPNGLAPAGRWAAPRAWRRRDAVVVEEIAHFLARHPPFDRLPSPMLQHTAATVEIE